MALLALNFDFHLSKVNREINLAQMLNVCANFMKITATNHDERHKQTNTQAGRRLDLRA